MSETRLEEAIAEGVEDLRQAADQLQALLAAASSGEETSISREVCVAIHCPCRRLLRQTLVETISVLDDTRKSFKSKQLAVLRHALIERLANYE